MRGVSLKSLWPRFRKVASTTAAAARLWWGYLRARSALPGVLLMPPPRCRVDAGPLQGPRPRESHPGAVVALRAGGLTSARVRRLPLIVPGRDAPWLM